MNQNNPDQLSNEECEALQYGCLYQHRLEDGGYRQCGACVVSIGIASYESLTSVFDRQRRRTINCTEGHHFILCTRIDYREER